MSDFNTVPGLFDVNQPIEAEKKLSEKFGSDVVRKLTAQWSQLVAWSRLAFDDYEEGKKPSADQENLRHNFIDTVKKLARYCMAKHYCPDMFEDEIFELNAELSKFLNEKKENKQNINLADIYKHLTNKNDYVFNEELTQSFVWVVTVDGIDAWLAGYNQKKDKFVMVLPYPPDFIPSPSVLKPEFNTVGSLLGVYEQTPLEKKLMERFGSEPTEKAQQFVTQWSQLVAWSWLEPDDYEEGKKPKPEEENLRKSFIAVVKELASYCIANNYYPGMFVEQIYLKSEVMSQYLNGEMPQSGLKLPELYKQLTNRNDYAFKEEFINNFIWMVTVDRFNGWFAGYNEAKDKFLMVLAYPPRPPLSPAVLQASDLRDWSQGKGDGEYIPPNPYIPTCLC